MPFQLVTEYFIIECSLQTINQTMNGRNLYTVSSSQKNLHANIMVQKNNLYPQSRQLQAHNLYYDNSPYFSNENSNHYKVRGIFNTSRNTNQSRQISQTSSQRSGKLIRTNGLKLAQKPRLGRQKMIDRRQNDRSNQQTRKLYQKNMQLQEQNKYLVNQNQKLKQKIRMMDQIHRKQVQSINIKIDGIVSATEDMEKSIQKEASQWKKQLDQIQYNFIKNSKMP